MTITFVVGTFLAWSIIPSNVAGRTKRTVFSTFSFVGYCAGNMTGSQIFLAKDAVSQPSSAYLYPTNDVQPRYIPGTLACAGCLGAQMILIFVWRTVLVMRNKRRDERMKELDISEEERIKSGKELGEQDCTDFENPFVSFNLDVDLDTS